MEIKKYIIDVNTEILNKNYWYEDIKKTLKLPNFDYNIFEKISGINKEDIEEKLNELKYVQNNE